MKHGCTILVVDDDSESLTLLTGILTAEGYHVRPADSGELALASIAAKAPELILLDIRMPGVDGFEVCRRLKGRQETRDIPLVFLSAAREVEERVEGLRLGAVDFISKPFQHDELLARVRTHLELGSLRADLERQVAERTAELRRANELLQAELAEHRRTEQALRESEERFRSLANRAPVGIWVTGPDKRLTFYNRRALTFAGRAMPQLTEDGWTKVVHPEDRESVQAKYAAAVEARRSFRIECRIRRANGKYRWVLHTGIPRCMNGVYSGHIGTSIDITDLKRSHERMLVTQKLESLGVLAAGIAHDFNNLVGSIFAASDLALSELPPDSPARENIERINAVANRASEIVNLLLAYAGGHGAEIGKLDLSVIVAEMLELLKVSVSSKAVWDVNLDRDLPAIRANATQIRQVVLNLIMNASESLQKREGVVKVTTGRMYVGPAASAERTPDLPEGEYCFLVVSDTGSGMTPEVRAKVFDPFYTTKCLGRGLGLAVVHGILRSLGGAINVVSAPGIGSTFEVLLPCADRSSEDTHHMAQAAAGCELSHFSS